MSEVPSVLPNSPNNPTELLNRPVRYFALVCDYDGTIASAGAVSSTTLQALKQLKSSGRKVVLVTGRRLNDLRFVFPELGIFDRIVAENGALLYRPESGETSLLASAPPPAFAETLAARGVKPLDSGACIVATWEPNDAAVLAVIRDMGLELQVIYNKGAVMILPSGVNKSTGMLAALLELGISPHNAVAIGDAENDHALLDACAVAVAVQNSIDTLKQKADIIMEAANGEGTRQLIARILKDDLREAPDRRGRSCIPLGTTESGTPVSLDVWKTNLLIAGPSSSGKSTIVHGLLEPMLEGHYQVCLVDPEGDYEQVDNIFSMGTSSRAPELTEVLKALENSSASVSVNLLGMPLDERPQFFGALLLRLQEMRARLGRPHWIIFDEAHHLMPSSWRPAADLPELQGVVLVTVHPEAISPEARKLVRQIVAVGPNPEETLLPFVSEAGWPAPPAFPAHEPGNVLAWFRDESGGPFSVRMPPPKKEIRRHKRKYAEGQLGDDRSFFFRGPEGKLNLQAHNLAMFVQIAKGIDEDTWMHHLKRNDYSRWVRESIKDKELSSELLSVENDSQLLSQESRDRVMAAVQARYTADETNSTA